MSLLVGAATPPDVIEKLVCCEHAGVDMQVILILLSVMHAFVIPCVLLLDIFQAAVIGLQYTVRGKKAVEWSLGTG